MMLQEVGSHRRRLQAAAISVVMLLGVVASNDLGAQSTKNNAVSDHPTRRHRLRGSRLREATWSLRWRQLGRANPEVTAVGTSA
jgi:hypothetical protein